MRTSWLETLVYRVCAGTMIPATRKRNLGMVTGLEQLPAEGPFVIVANHASFFDHFLLATIVHDLYGKKLYFLTKKESFETPHMRLWFNSVGAIPVDRGGADRAAYRRVMELLSAGEIVCIYPEGTRGPGDTLLPFKEGAFRMGLRKNAPIIPAGINGAQHILPKGALWPRARRAGVAFGAPLDVASHGKNVGALMAESSRVIEQLALNEERPTTQPDAIATTTAFLAARAERLIESALDREVPAERRAMLGQAENLLAMALVNDPTHVSALVQRARIIGLAARDSALPVKLARAKRVKVLAEQIIARDPEQPMAHYILGNWHLEIPRPLGGELPSAVSHLQQAVTLAPDDTRYTLALVRALLKTGKKQDAVSPLLVSMAARPPLDARSAMRRQRAQALLATAE